MLIYLTESVIGIYVSFTDFSLLWIVESYSRNTDSYITFHSKIIFALEIPTKHSLYIFETVIWRFY